ncbi:MAG: adenylate/guanylate cyclase domain-containing protein [Ginsengibacter sp.]
MHINRVLFYNGKRFLKKWKIFVTFTCVTVLFTICYGQGKKDKSPQEADTIAVNDLIAKSKAFADNQQEQAISYGIQAKQLSETIGYTKGTALALKNIGNIYYTQGKYLEAINYWTQSLTGFRTINDLVGVSNILNNIGVIHSIQGDYQKALANYLEALKAAEQSGNKGRIASSLNNVGATYALRKETYDKALQYYLRALTLSEEAGDTNSIGTTSVNIGEVYSNKGNGVEALKYFNKSLKIYTASRDEVSIPYTYNAIAKEYKKEGKYDSALQFHQKAYATSRKVDKKLYMLQSLLGLANTYTAKGDAVTALDYYKKAEETGKEIGAIDELKDIYLGLSAVYSSVENYRSAFKYQSLYSNIKDTIYNIESDKKLANLQFDFDLQKKQGEINLLTKDKALQQLDLKRQRLTRNALIGGLVLVFIILFILYRDNRNKIKTNKILDSQKAEIENLLLNILPPEVAHELRKTGFATPRFYEKASVLFTDFKSFTKLVDGLTPQEIVSELDACFIGFDDIIEKYKLEKIKTIGDSYMCAGGLSSGDDLHPINIVKASLEIQQFIRQRNESRKEMGMASWDVRIGINIGPVVAGVVGRKKYAYDIWGGTVNIASRMESNGEPGRVNISAAVYELIRHNYACTYRGKIFAKNIGEIDMYYVDHEINNITPVKLHVN